MNTEVRLFKALLCPVATYGCESWVMKKADESRTEAFEVKGLRHTLRV